MRDVTVARRVRRGQVEAALVASRAAVGSAADVRPRRRPRSSSNDRPRQLRSDRADGGRGHRQAVTPMPTSTQASSGSAAASPHTPTGLPAWRPASARDRDQREHGGLPRVGEVREVGRPSGRRPSCTGVRSLVPIERKSTTSSIRWASSAALGTSTITPALQAEARDLCRRTLRPRRRWPPSAPSPRPRCRSTRRAAATRIQAGGPASPGCSNDSRRPRDAEARGSPRPSRRGEGHRLVRAGVEGAHDDVSLAAERASRTSP